MGCGSSTKADNRPFNHNSYDNDPYANQNGTKSRIPNQSRNIDSWDSSERYSRKDYRRSPELIRAETFMPVPARPSIQGRHCDRGRLNYIAGHLPYALNDTRIQQVTIDFRVSRNSEVNGGDPPPRVRNGELWVDSEFTLKHAMAKLGSGVEWKRPQEICNSPCLFSDGTTRYDIGQGAAGTCWFLSLVATISEKPELLNRIIPGNAYPTSRSQYRGIFHCRFWRFGHWQSLFTDDYLPVVYGDQLWGAKSATDPNEMWVALLEKAFSKFHGSYAEIDGGSSAEAFLSLTGGVAKIIDITEAMNPQELFRHIHNALRSGAMITCQVPAANDKVHGLIGEHVYSLTSTSTVSYRNEKVDLFQVRNPWGICEWKGAWSDGSREWQSVPHLGADKDDGEFWISTVDFCRYFSQTTICSLTPDFDKDGGSDNLNHMCCIYGEWRGETAAGFDNKLNNPKYLITVPGEETDDPQPLVIQIIQYIENRKIDKLPIRCDVYKVLFMSERSDRQKLLLVELGDDDTSFYRSECQVLFHHSTPPGQYLLVPSTSKARQEKQFLVRVYSAIPLADCSLVDSNATLLSCELKDPFPNSRKAQELVYMESLFGGWIKGVNAGGQISHPEHYTNPQLSFSVPPGENVTMVFTLMQDYTEPKLPVGLKVYPVLSGTRIPVNRHYIMDNLENASLTISGEKGRFILDWSFDIVYILQQGDYVAMIFTDRPGIRKGFAVVVRSSAEIQLSLVNDESC